MICGSAPSGVVVSLTERAALRTHGLMQGVAGVVHDGCQLCQHLLSPTVATEPRGHPRTELDIRTSFSIFPLSLSVHPPPQQIILII